MHEDNEFILPIFNDSPDYILGFEAGQVFELLHSGQVIEGRPVRKANKAQLEMICVEYAAEYTFENTDSHWAVLSATPKIGELM